MGEVARATVRVVGRYAIFDELAAGGMATVFLGRLMGSGGFTRTVAIKSLHPQFATDPEFVSMFLDEARLAARIRHPNVVPTLDVVASKGEVFLVMEYVQGDTLSRLMRRLKVLGERAPLPILLRIMTDVLHGLHAAHEACDERGVALQIVHRDVSPQNVLVGIDGVGRLLDFGVAKAAGRAQTTREGQLKGKLSYMAPEQLTDAGVTRQTDIYAASVLLWEALTGERLFAGQNELDLIAQLLKRQIRPPSQIVRDIPPALEAVVMRGLEAKPEDRFATAREMCTALAKCGVPEAPSLSVGEWVETLAADVLAERSAKISAIENRPEGRPAGGSAPDGDGLSPSVRPPTDSGIPTIDRPDLAPQEPRSEVLSIPVPPGVPRRRRQARVWSVAGALALFAIGGTVLIERSVRRDGASAAPSQGASVASAPAQPEPVAVLLPPVVPAVPIAPTDPPPVASNASAAPQPRPPTARPVGPSFASRGAASAAPPRSDKSKAANDVFDSRE
jgi:serine/threonine protein kinase